MTVLWLKLMLVLLTSVFTVGEKAFALTELRTASQDAYPKYYLENGHVTGVCPAILKIIEKADPALKFVGLEHFFPTRRIDNDLRQGRLDAFACFAPSADRKLFMDFIEPPLFVNDVRVAVQKNSQAAQMKSWEEMKAKKEWIFLATQGTPHVDYLKGISGLRVDAGSSDNVSNLIKLKMSRGHAFVHFGYILKGILKKENLEEEIILLPFTIRSEGQYLALSKKVSPKIKKKLETVLKKLKKSGELKKISDQYILE
jgi:polar amino acid transport system substrate-binding protein